MTRHDIRSDRNRFATIAVGAAETETHPHRNGTNDVVPPIHLSTTFEWASGEDANEHDYSRESNPTRATLEEQLARLEGGEYGLAFASGMAATSTTMLSLVSPGGHIKHRAVRLGFDPTKFGAYNTAPTRQTLTTAWDVDLSDAAKRALLSVSERLVDAAYENNDALDLRPPRHVEDTDSDLRDRHVSEFSNDQIRQTVRLARETVFGAFDSGRADNAVYPDSRFDELQALMALGGSGTPSM